MNTRIASLDLLRGVAAAAVAISHFFAYSEATAGQTAWEIPSVIGVEVFFVLSGFVLAPQIIFVADSKCTRAIVTFLVRRWMRTVPPYVVALVFMTALTAIFDPADFVRYVTYTQNLFRQHNGHDYFSVAWSLSVEEWFYLLFPATLVAAALLLRSRGTRIAVPVALFFVVIVAIARLNFTDTLNWGANVRRVVAFRIDSIALGFLFYLFWRRFSLALHSAECLFVSVPAAIVTAALMVAALLHIDSGTAEIAFPYLAAVFGAACVATSISLDGRLSSAGRKAADLIGKLSYPTYLFHLMAIYLASAPFGLGFSAFVAFLMLTLMFAVGSFFLIEQPILALRPKYHSGEAQRPAAAASRAVAS